jgi:hypothetical protein
MKFNSDSQVFGAYGLLQPRSTSWKNYLYHSNAVVGQTVSGHLDRFYFFDNTIYQWNAPNQIVALVYIDFVPRTFLQTAFLSYQQEWSKQDFSTFDLTAIDTIEYSRRKGVLEILAPSPYREGSASLRHKMTEISFLNLKATHGRRLSDQLKKTEFTVGPTFSRFLGPHFSAGGLLGVRRNFTSTDLFARFDLGYFSKFWEASLGGEYGSQRQNDGKTYHPVIAEAAISHFISRELYATLSLQNASTERVTIYSTFLKLGYRFGSSNVAPLRDGAPPPGRP